MKSHHIAGQFNLKGKREKLLSCKCCTVIDLRGKYENDRMKKFLRNYEYGVSMTETGRMIGLVSVNTETGETKIRSMRGLIDGPTLTQDQARRAMEWAQGSGLIQRILPDLDDDTRELFLSGMSGGEFDDEFRDDE